MDYLTNHYKNLSEQLQERVNQLQNILNEGRAVRDPVTGEYRIVGNDIHDYEPKPIPMPAPKMVPGPTYNVHVKPPMPKPLPTKQPGKTIIGLSPEQIDAANDPNQGGQSGKFGDSIVDMSGNKDDWMGIEPPPTKLKPQPSFVPKKMIKDSDIFDVIPKKPKIQLINQERPLDVPPMSQDSVDYFRKTYMDKQQPKYELEKKSNLPTNITPLKYDFIQKKYGFK